jgi:hypothetical protein
MITPRQIETPPFVEAAGRHAEFAEELLHFLDGIRAVLSLEEAGDYIDQLELMRPLSSPPRGAVRALSGIGTHP